MLNEVMNETYESIKAMSFDYKLFAANKETTSRIN